jgi:hypothetical protein
MPREVTHQVSKRLFRLGLGLATLTGLLGVLGAGTKWS